MAILMILGFMTVIAVLIHLLIDWISDLPMRELDFTQEQSTKDRDTATRGVINACRGFGFDKRV